MARLPFIDPIDEPEQLRPVFDQLRETRGRVPGMYKLLAHQPGVLNAHRAYFNAALDAGILPRTLKEKIAFKVARIHGSAYSSASHRRYALNHGVTEDEIEAVDRSDYSGFPPDERAALEFAEEMAERNGEVGESRFEALKAHYHTPEIIEIVALVGIMGLASIYAAVFGLEPDRSEAK